MAFYMVGGIDEVLAKAENRKNKSGFYRNINRFIQRIGRAYGCLVEALLWRLTKLCTPI
jgi:hypothetical protein